MMDTSKDLRGWAAKRQRVCSASRVGLVALLLLPGCDGFVTVARALVSSGASESTPESTPTRPPRRHPPTAPGAQTAALDVVPDPGKRPRSSTVRPEECPQVVVPREGITGEIRALLAREQYSEIEARLAAYDRAYTQNYACEYAVWRGYCDVAYGDAQVQQQVEQWVRS